MADRPLHISVVYACAEEQAVVKLQVESGTTAQDAVALSGLPRRFPAIAAAPLHCAIYSRLVPLSQPLQNGDRVEILRPLLADPKEQRRAAAARNRVSRAK